LMLPQSNDFNHSIINHEGNDPPIGTSPKTPKHETLQPYLYILWCITWHLHPSNWYPLCCSSKTTSVYNLYYHFKWNEVNFNINDFIEAIIGKKLTPYLFVLNVESMAIKLLWDNLTIVSNIHFVCIPAIKGMSVPLSFW